MKKLLLVTLLIFGASSVSALELSIKHNKKLPTPHELITKGTILDKEMIKTNAVYIIAWDKTDDIYRCSVFFDSAEGVQRVKCYLAIQETITGR